jgi:hypothetical protein
MGEASKANGKDRSGEVPKDDPKSEQMSFWDYAESFGDQWLGGDLKAYIYRVWPKIDRQQDKVYLSIVQEPPTEEFLLRTYGSGRYLVLLKRRGKLLRKHTASVHNRDFPPKLDESEVVDDPVNESYWRAWGKKSSAGASKPEAEPSKNDIAEIIRAAREGNKLEPHVIEWIQDFANHRDDLAAKLAEATAKNPTADLASLLTALKGVFPMQQQAAAPPVDTLAIIKSLRELQPEPVNPLDVLQQAREIFAPQPAANDDFARFEKFLSVADRLAGWRGAPSRESGWQTALNFVREAPAVISPILTFIGNSMALRNGGMAPQAAPGHAPGRAGPPASWDPYRDQAQTLAYARELRNQPAPPPASVLSPSEAPVAGSADRELSVVLQQYGQLALNALNADVRGFEFAENVIALLGAGTQAAFANYGKDQLVSAMMNIPEFQVFGQPRLSQFADEFIHFQEFREEEEDGDEQHQAASAAR